MELIFELEKLLTEFLRSEGCLATVKFLDKRICIMGDAMVTGKYDTDIHFDVKLLQQTSTNWPLPVDHVSFDGNVARIWFDRALTMRKVIISKEWETPMKKCSDSTELIYLEEQQQQYQQQQQQLHQHQHQQKAAEGGVSKSMTTFRSEMVRNVLSNCLIHAGYSVVGREQMETESLAATVKRIAFVQRKSKPSIEQNDATARVSTIEILCGPVMTESDLVNVDGYMCHRANEMQLIAQHRYGVRFHDVNELQRTVVSLGRSAAIVDVLQMKPSVPIDMRSKATGITSTPNCTKGAAFILYNFARLATLFKKYQRLVEQNDYPPIPPAEETDFTLLTDADEWNLLYVYVIGFPMALRGTLGYGQLERVSPHHLLDFTFGLVQCLSKYYRRVRILTGNRPKLLPVMFARLHLLDAIFKVLQRLLKLIGLEPIEEM